MFRLFKKKKEQKDPVLEQIKKMTRELGDINSSIRRNNEELMKSIEETEAKLRDIGYTDEDLERIKLKSKLKVVK